MARSRRRQALCLVPGCGRPVHSRGYCMSHYRQLLRGHTPSGPIQPRGQGPNPILSVRIPAPLLRRVDRALRGTDTTRSRLVQRLLDGWADRQTAPRRLTPRRSARRAKR